MPSHCDHECGHDAGPTGFCSDSAFTKQSVINSSHTADISKCFNFYFTDPDLITRVNIDIGLQYFFIAITGKFIAAFTVVRHLNS